MNYYIYEHDSERKMRIHIGSCKYCNYGKGINTIGQPKTRWHGPFDTLEAAQVFATGLQRKNTRTCAHCLDGKRF